MSSAENGAGSGKGGAGNDEMSVDETNKLRVSLGLAPLAAKPTAADKAKVDKERRDAADKRKSEAKAVDEAKKQKLEKMKVKGESLGDTLKTTEIGSTAADWVKRSRQREKFMAAERAKQFEQQDQDEILAQQEKKGYNSRQLKGLKVAHDLDQFSETEIVLTLKDTGILKGNEALNDAEDELESVQLVDEEKREKYAELKKKKPKYDVFDDDANDVLKQYNDEKEKEGLRLGAGGKFNVETEEDKMDAIRARLSATSDAQVPQKKVAYDLNATKNVASDYLRPEDMVIRKKKKTGDKKHRKKPEQLSDILPEPEDAARHADHASRDDSVKLRIEQWEAKKSQDQRDAAYLKAVQKSADKTELLKAASAIESIRDKLTKKTAATAAAAAENGEAKEAHAAAHAPSASSTASSKPATPVKTESHDTEMRDADASPSTMPALIPATPIQRSGPTVNVKKEPVALGGGGGSSTTLVAGALDAKHAFDEDDDAELAAMLSRARRVALEQGRKEKKKRDVAQEMAENVKAARVKQEAEENTVRIKNEDGSTGAKVQLGDDDSIVFTATTEFCRGLEETEKAPEGAGEAEARKLKDELEEQKRHDWRASMSYNDASLTGGAGAGAATEGGKKKKGPPPPPKQDNDMEVDHDLPKALAVTRKDGEDDKEDKDKEGKDKDDDDDDGDDDDDDVSFLHDEPLAARGMFAALNLAKRRGFVEPDTEQFGRAGDKVPSVDARAFKEDPAPHLILEHLDEKGRQLKPKEAFRRMSHVFHGKGPSMQKKEKLLKKEKDQKKALSVLSVNASAAAVISGKARPAPKTLNQKLREKQKQTGQAFVVLDKKMTTGAKLTKNIKGAKPSKNKDGKGTKRKRDAGAGGEAGGAALGDGGGGGGFSDGAGVTDVSMGGTAASSESFSDMAIGADRSKVAFGIGKS